MPIMVTCDCGSAVRAKDEWAGRKARCPSCSRVLVVPDPNKKKAKEEEVVECDVAEEEEEILEVEAVEERRPTGVRTASDRRVTDRPRARLARDEDDEDEDDRPRRRRDREEERRPPKRVRRRMTEGYNSGTAVAGIFGGLAMMIGAVVWFVLGLMGDIIFFYPPILFVLGIIAFVKGIMGRE